MVHHQVVQVQYYQNSKDKKVAPIINDTHTHNNIPRGVDKSKNDRIHTYTRARAMYIIYENNIESHFNRARGEPVRPGTGEMYNIGTRVYTFTSDYEDVYYARALSHTWKGIIIFIQQRCSGSRDVYYIFLLPQVYYNTRARIVRIVQENNIKIILCVVLQV